MYKAFFQLKRNPFEISPDPFFLYPTVGHHEALATLYHGIRAGKGFVVLTGEVGTGKTMVVRCLLEKLEKSRIHFAYVFNTRLSSRDFLRYLVGDLGLPANGKGKSELLLRLHDFLIRRHSQGYTTVLVVDEAHLLRQDVLEEIRLLTNLETSREKLLQIALVGQPELDERLDSARMRQLKQRIALRYQLQPLTLQETCGYIDWRLNVAGRNRDDSIFPRETVEVIHQYSCGYPRLINTICDNALISAYAAGCHSISVGQIEDVCHGLRLSAEAAPNAGGPKANGQSPPPDLTQALQELADTVRTVTQTYLARTSSTEKKNS